MHRRMALWATVLLLLSVMFLAATASAKGVLDILREKGILSEEEYKQAVDEAREQEKKSIQQATEEGKKTANCRIGSTEPRSLATSGFAMKASSIPSSPMCWITRTAT